jgi:hypothetical protein
MPQLDWGPVNLTYGNSAFFTVEFYDNNGFITTPSAASITLTYTNRSNTTQVDVTTLSPTGSYFTGTWSSTSATYGLVNWVVSATGGSSAMQDGQIRVIYP